jgi:hypothetical protein
MSGTDRISTLKRTANNEQKISVVLFARSFEAGAQL